MEEVGEIVNICLKLALKNLTFGQTSPDFLHSMHLAGTVLVRQGHNQGERSGGDCCVIIMTTHAGCPSLQTKRNYYFFRHKNLGKVFYHAVEMVSGVERDGASRLVNDGITKL